jgi:hypothetical protein
MPWLTIIKWAGGILGGLALAWIVYAGLIRPTTKPNPTTTQKADNIINYNLTSRQSFGCSNFRIQRIPDETKTQITINPAQ